MNWPLVLRSTHQDALDTLKDYHERVSKAERDRYDALLLTYDELKEQCDKLLQSLVSENKTRVAEEKIESPKGPRRLSRRDIVERASRDAEERFKDSIRGPD